MRLPLPVGSFTPRLDWYYQSFMTNGPTTQQQIHPDWIIPGYSLFNARLTYTPLKGRWQLSFAGTNIFNKFYWQQLGAATSGTPPALTPGGGAGRHARYATRMECDRDQGFLRVFSKAACTAILCFLAACHGAPASESTTTVELQSRVRHLAAEVQAAEDLRAIKKLQRAYGYYLDKGMWEDLSQLFTTDAVANYPAGIYVGKESIRKHLFLNVGAVKMGEVGLGENRLYNHMNIQPVVHLDPGGQTAKGRWRALAMFGSLGGGATWAEGVYELSYRKDGGVWRIHTLEYYSGFGASYQTGWVAPPEARGGGMGGEAAGPGTNATAASGAGGAGNAGGRRRVLPYPPDRERKMGLRWLPCRLPSRHSITVTRGTTDSAHAWTVTDAPSNLPASPTVLRNNLADLGRRLLRLQDEQTVENLQRIYGYYLDRAMWDQVCRPVCQRCNLRAGVGKGVYIGKQHLRRFLDTLGRQGLTEGVLNDHIQLQTRVDIAPDGKTAYCRSRELAMTGVYSKSGAWSEGVYENTYVKDHGVWKFRSLHFYPTFSTDYDQGWGKSALPPPGPSTTVPPDRAPTELYGGYPKPYVPPYHYRNPGRERHLTIRLLTGADPSRGGGRRPHAHKRSDVVPKVKDPRVAVVDLQLQLDRIEAYEELEESRERVRLLPRQEPVERPRRPVRARWHDGTRAARSLPRAGPRTRLPVQGLRPR